MAWNPLFLRPGQELYPRVNTTHLIWHQEFYRNLQERNQEASLQHGLDCGDLIEDDGNLIKAFVNKKKAANIGKGTNESPQSTKKIFSHFKPIDIFIIRIRGVYLVFSKIDEIQKLENRFHIWDPDRLFLLFLTTGIETEGIM